MTEQQASALIWRAIAAYCRKPTGSVPDIANSHVIELDIGSHPYSVVKTYISLANSEEVVAAYKYSPITDRLRRLSSPITFWKATS